MKTPYQEQLVVRVTKDTKGRIKKAATKYEISESEFVREAIEEKLDLFINKTIW